MTFSCFERPAAFSTSCLSLGSTLFSRNISRVNFDFPHITPTWYQVGSQTFLSSVTRQFPFISVFFSPAGVGGILVMGLGIVISGVFILKVKPNARFVAAWIAFTAIVYAIGMGTLMFIGCPMDDFAGLQLQPKMLVTSFQEWSKAKQVSRYWQSFFVSFLGTPREVRSFDSHILNRRATWLANVIWTYSIQFVVQMGRRTSQIVTPDVQVGRNRRTEKSQRSVHTHLGLASLLNMKSDNFSFLRLQYSDCQCIGLNSTSSGNETLNTATPGYCKLECNNFWVYMILFSIFVFIHSTSEVGSMLLILRCVDPRDKAMALGLIQFAIGLFGLSHEPL